DLQPGVSPRAPAPDRTAAGSALCRPRRRGPGALPLLRCDQRLDRIVRVGIRVQDLSSRGPVQDSDLDAVPGPRGDAAPGLRTGRARDGDGIEVRAGCD